MGDYYYKKMDEYSYGYAYLSGRLIGALEIIYERRKEDGSVSADTLDSVKRTLEDLNLKGVFEE